MRMHHLLGSAAMALLLVGLPASSGANQPVPLQPQEVREMYAGKTWVWDAGGGYFAPDGSYQAWTQDSEHGLMHATGRWSVEIGGQLCYSARWHYANTSNTSQDCFAHWESNGVVLQRDEREGGEWYRFGQRSGAGYDSPRLQQGNLVAVNIPQHAAGLQQ